MFIGSYIIYYILYIHILFIYSVFSLFFFPIVLWYQFFVSGFRQLFVFGIKKAFFRTTIRSSSAASWAQPSPSATLRASASWSKKSSTSRMRSAARQHYSFPTTAGCCCRRCGWWWPYSSFMAGSWSMTSAYFALISVSAVPASRALISE